MGKKITPLERAKQWLETERAIFDGNKEEPNEFDLYVPLEVRERSLLMRNNGITPTFSDAHLELWVALSEVMGVEKFDEPLGWSREKLQTHLFGQ